jgi:pimeloyl-ACP methyl ester carboxylesterase
MPLKPLVFIPGVPGTVILEPAADLELFPSALTLLSTTLRDHLVARLAGPEDPGVDDGIVAGDPVDSLLGLKSSFIDFSGSLKLADSLYAILGDLGYTTSRPFGDRFRPVGWDWRLPVYQPRTLDALKQAITDLHTATGERVVVLCHSTGGLVTRSLLERDPDLAGKIDLILAVAVPWVGTLQTLPYLAGYQNFGPLTTGQTQKVLAHSWAAFDLLPPDPQRTDMRDAAGNALDFFTTDQGPASPLIERAWMAGPLAQPMTKRANRSGDRLGNRTRSLGPGLDVVTFAGWGAETRTGCQMDSHGKLTFLLSDEGDGTVPGRSADWLSGAGVKNFLVPVGHYPDSQITREHSALWMNPPVSDLLGTLLAGKPRKPYAYAAVDDDDAANKVSQVRVRIVAQNADGQPLPGARAVAFPNSPSEIRSGFNGEARLLMHIPRAGIVHEIPGGLLRFEMEIHWQEGGVDKSSRQALLVHKV